jgi:ketose-bisphosphate aldolase
MLVSFKELLTETHAAGYAVGYFEAWDVYSLEAVLDAAESEDTPVIIGIGGVMMEPHWFDGGGLERLAALGVATAERARVPVSFILNEVATFALVVRGIHAGFNAVMLDSSHLPYHEHVCLTQRIVEIAHTLGAGVEAEVGMLPDASGEMGGPVGCLTDPYEAAHFVSDTGVDVLAVSIGNVHSLIEGQAVIDLERLAAIHQAVSVPLAIHGGTGFPEEVIPQAIALGVAKFNIGVALKRAFLAGLTEAVRALSGQVNAHHVIGSRKEADILQQGKIRMREEVVRRMRLLRPDVTMKTSVVPTVEEGRC